jgi:hypothetical protein
MKRFNTFIAALLLTSSLTPAVNAQQPAQVIGPITPGDLSVFNSPTIIKDSGIPASGGVSTILDQICSTNNDSLIRLAGTWQCGLFRQQILSQTFYVNASASATAPCGASGASTCAIGNDANTCRTPAQACLTFVHVRNLILSSYDAGNTSFGVDFADSVASSDGRNYAGDCINGPFIGAAVIQIAGNHSDNTKVKIQAPDNGNVSAIGNSCTISYQDVHFIDSPSANAQNFISAGGGHGYAHVDLINVVVDALAVGNAFNASSGSGISINGCSIIGNVFTVALATQGGVIDFLNQPCPVSNNLTFNTFAIKNSEGVIAGVNASTFGSPTGTTGSRCNIIGTWTISTNVNPNKIFPGSTNCTIATGTAAIGLQSGSGGSSIFDYGTAGHALLSGGAAGTPDTWDAAGVSCPSGITAGTVVVVNGLVTHC